MVIQPLFNKAKSRTLSLFTKNTQNINIVQNFGYAQSESVI